MAKVNREVNDPSPIAEAIERVLHDTAPVLICGVNRKANIGNYETVDVYVGVTMPMPEALGASPEELRTIVAEHAELGISMAAKETADRYTAIKNLMSGN